MHKKQRILKFALFQNSISQYRLNVNISSNTGSGYSSWFDGSYRLCQRAFLLRRLILIRTKRTTGGNVEDSYEIANIMSKIQIPFNQQICLCMYVLALYWFSWMLSGTTTFGRLINNWRYFLFYSVIKAGLYRQYLIIISYYCHNFTWVNMNL